MARPIATPRKRRGRLRDERGATFIITAVAMVLLLWAGAMGVDIGFTVDSNRQAQSIADTAALDLARYINIADSKTKTGSNNIATYMAAKLAAVSTDNGLNGTTLSWVGGYWSAAGGWQAATGGCYAQLRTNNPPCTAVKVTATQPVPRIFAGGSGSATRSAVGYLNPSDGFSIGTYLANLNSQQGAVLNAIMSQLSSSANLSLVSYEGLADTYVTINQLIAASAVSGVVLSPSTVMTTSLTGAQWLSIFKAAANTQQLALNCASTPEPSPCVAYTALQSLTGNGSSSATLCQLVWVNGACGPNPVSEAGLSASVDVLQTLEEEAELAAANGSNGIDFGTSLGLSGVTDAKLVLTMIQPPQVAYGSPNTTPVTSATSAQVQSVLQLTIPGVGQINVGLGAAEGTATLSSVTCTQTNNSFSQAVVNASTTAATGSVTLTDSALGLSNYPIATTSASGVNSTPVGFTAPIPPTTSEFGSTTVANPVQIGATSSTVTITALGGLGSGILAVLTSNNLLITQLQSALSGILQAAGVTVAGADIADLAIDCDTVSLAQ
jgi:uncharacterized membrane protein